ncbi:MAG: BamA/TamA family outer membrane protein [Acidobacteria bacterium]|nr:BamA/TamA family outer membrane protein [Acidobacteriota bacterium]
MITFALSAPFDTRSLSFVGGIPIFERFYLGGEYDIRGYNFRSISPVVPSDSFLSTRNVKAKIPDPADPNKLIDAPAGLVSPSVIRNYTFEAPGKRLRRADVSRFEQGLQHASGAQVLHSHWRRHSVHPITSSTASLFFSVLSIAAFADVGSSF